MLFLTAALLKINTNKNIELNYYKNKQVTPRDKTKNSKVSKDINQYSNVIHMINKYNGEIKEFKTNNNSGDLVDADILVTGNEHRLSDFLGELKQYKDLKDFNSITLDNTSGNVEKYSIEVNAEFKTGKR